MNDKKNTVYEPYFGISQTIRKVKRHAALAANEHCAVLILGETGAGKGVLARWIHDRSPRRDRAFVDINCSGLGGDLLKCELFGHAKGAFTGAVGERAGLIEEADGGTLFLDEIGDMEVGVQCLLLKAVEEKAYRRVGENELCSSDFRLICATNRNLQKAMEEGRFREDLFYRINTLTVSLPPLRERRRDIPGLLNHILADMGYAHFPVDGSVTEALARHCWRGNIRELRNALVRALVFARGEPLATGHFSGIIGDAYPVAGEIHAEPEVEVAEPQAVYAEGESDALDLWEMEKEYIRRALKHFGGDKSRASAALGISLSSLYRRLDEMKE